MQIKTNHLDDNPWGKPGKGPGPNDLDELLKNSQEKFKTFFKNGGYNTGGTNPTQNPKKYLIPAILVAFVLWFATGFYVVEEGEQAVVMRFGKFVRTATAGPNYHIPEPIENMMKYTVDRLEKVEIGFRSGAQAESRPNLESLMLTGDENIVYINFVVQWKINNISDYVFNVSNPKETVKGAAESAMREVIANTPLASALTEGRSVIERKALLLLQQMLDSYKSGVEVVNLQMLKSDPPTEVVDAFRDVQTARSDKEREINQAYAFQNDIIPRARGEAAKIIQDAEAYKQQVVDKATGEASRFTAIYQKYKNAKDVTRKRIYYETMEEILGNTNKMILDNTDKSVLPYLPLPNLNQDKKS